jgi:hypothetical protein
MKGVTVYLPSDIARSSSEKVQERFRQNGIHLGGEDGREEIVKSLSHFNEAPASALLDQVGWNGTYFVRPDGHVLGSTDQQRTKILPLVSPGICQPKGMLEQWQTSVAAAVSNDCIPALAILAQFAAPVLALANAGHLLAFEVVEPSGRSIGCLPHLMASVNGGLGPRVGQRYAIPFGDLVDDPAGRLASRADSPMIIDGHSMHMLGQSASRRLENVKALLSLGREGISSTYVLSGRDALIDLTDEDSRLEVVRNPGAGNEAGPRHIVFGNGIHASLGGCKTQYRTFKPAFSAS